VAGGIDAQLIAALETDEQDWRNYERAQARRERKKLDDLDRAIDDMAKRARDLAREVLNAAGYFQHHRGEWRKSRVR
jgi:hypothetical protein